MKRTIISAILTAVAAFAFADEAPQIVSLSANEFPLEVKPSFQEKISDGKSLIYFRLGVSDSDPTKALQVVPGLGVGYRLGFGRSGLDVSANYMGFDAIPKLLSNKTDENHSYFWTAPKASYLHYLSPKKSESFYGGVGLAWGGLKTKSAREFVGLIPSATLGYEMNRKARIGGAFVELNVSQPALAYTTAGAFPGPLAEMSVGAGF